ncbi:MAG TPA: GNAT family N-acetyltransferase [Porticoccaceae bacterium]|nr:GNAT family N-acetyltransferase [Porticoccaceae bacterium]
MTNRSPPSSAASVVHQPGRHRFLCLVDGQEAVLDYRQAGAGQVDFCHTYVPEALRGRGIAEALVHAGLAWARSEGLDTRASCWYVARWLHR